MFYRRLTTCVFVALLCAAASVAHAQPVCSSDSWCWSNPLPQGSTLRSVWGSASTDVWAVGDGPIHWDGNAWSAVSSGTTSRLSGVWGSASNDVWAVGPYSTILHWDGNAWSGSSSGTQSPLYAVWGSASTDVWAVGDPGAILHRQSEATATTTPITDDADSFTGTAGTVLSSYRPGIWQQIDGSAFEMEVSTPTSGATGAGQSLTGQLDANLKVNPWANDQWARITLNSLNTNAGGVVLRWNGSNGYAFGRDNNNHLPDGYLIEITDADLGTTTVLAGPTGTPAVGDVIEARVKGSSLTLLVNGNTLLTATDSTITSGQPGLFVIDWAAAGEQNLTAWSAGHFQ